MMSCVILNLANAKSQIKANINSAVKTNGNPSHVFRAYLHTVSMFGYQIW